MLHDKRYPILFLLPAMALFTLFFIVPNVAGLFMAFTDWSAFYPLSPSFNGLRNFEDLFASTVFGIAVRNTFIFTAITTLLKITLGFLLAIVLNNKLKLTGVYRTIIFSPVVMNPLVIAIVFSALYQPEHGLINTFLHTVGLDFMAQQWLIDKKVALLAVAFMEVWMGIGIIVVIFLAGLQTVPHEYYEAAEIDGAGGWSRFLHVTLPLTVHSLTINTILCLINGTKVFGQVYGLTNGGPADSTQVYGTFIFKSFSEGMFGYAAAAGLLFTVVLSTVSFLVLGFFRKMEVEH